MSRNLGIWESRLQDAKKTYGVRSIIDWSSAVFNLLSYAGSMIFSHTLLKHRILFWFGMASALASPTALVESDGDSLPAEGYTQNTNTSGKVIFRTDYFLNRSVEMIGTAASVHDATYVLIGETHTDPDRGEFQRNIVEPYNTTPGTCLFLESAPYVPYQKADFPRHPYAFDIITGFENMSLPTWVLLNKVQNSANTLNKYSAEKKLSIFSCNFSYKMPIPPVPVEDCFQHLYNRSLYGISIGQVQRYHRELVEAVRYLQSHQNMCALLHEKCLELFVLYLENVKALFDGDHITDRNKHMLAVIRENRKNCKKIFVIAGSGHFFPRNETHDPAQELRDGLSNESYIALRPK